MLGSRFLTVRPICLLVCLLPGALIGAERKGPLPPQQALLEIQLADPELVIELVATEPAVNSPVAVTWDAAGRMYVVEMSDYPVAESGGKIKRLEDRDGDGVYETALTFADGLKFPNGALPWNGGLLVTSAPDILFFKDTDNDGIADERRVILTGFAEGNQQLRVNGLLWGLDNWVYGANGRSGGAIRGPDEAPSNAVSIDRRDFRFRPASGKFEALAGFSQFGLARDDFNHRFLSWNTIPIRHVVLEERDLNRNPFLTMGESIAVITDASDTGRVFPASAPPATFNRERTDYFNASCGLTIFRGAGLGPKYRGNAFVAEPLTNLVHRKSLVPQGSTFLAKREEQEREFLAARDGWFHPVNLATGPDDCLYIADFYREWVEHPKFVPEKLRNSVDFRAGNEHGRIWRIRRRDFSPRMPSPALESLGPKELVARLDSNQPWTRDTAQRLLVERQEKSVIPILVSMAAESSSPVSRVQSLWTLAGLSALTPEAVSRALQDPAADVREQGILLFRGLEMPAAAAAQVLALTLDSEPHVRLQATLAAGDLDSPGALAALVASVGLGPSDNWQRLAVLSGLGRRAWPFVEALVRQQTNRLKAAAPEEQMILHEAAGMIGLKNENAELTGLVKLVSELPPTTETAAWTLLSGLGDGLARRRVSLHDFLAGLPTDIRPQLAAVERRIASARRMAEDRQAPQAQRLLTFRIVLLAQPATARLLIAAMLTSDESTAIQSAAARGLAELGDPDLARTLLESWGTYRVNTRAELIAALVRNAALAAPLIEALEAEMISPAELDVTARVALSRAANPELRTRVAKLFEVQPNGDRDAVIARYQPALDLNGDAKLGAALFAKHCLACHRMQGEGVGVGPDLSGIASRPKSALLEDILNPGKETSPDFVNYVVVTKRAQIFTGLLAADTPTSVRLRGPQGAEETILREEIEELRRSNQSLMPNGFEQLMPPQELAHLIEFLRHPVPLPSAK